MYKNIEELIKDDSKWRKIAWKFTKDELLSDELVHCFYEAYIRIKKSEPNKLVDVGYVYTALFNLNLKEIKRRGKFSSKELTDSIETYDLEKDNEKQSQIDFILLKLDGLDWFHRTIYKYVVMEGIAMRKLARDTGIHYNIIQKSVADTTEFLKQNFNNEFRV